MTAGNGAAPALAPELDRRLETLGAELVAIGRSVEEASRRLAGLPRERPMHPVDGDEMSIETMLALAVATIQRRTFRDAQFRSALFADPAWDMLLDLFAARLKGKRICVSSLCIAARVPPTTALRWIRNMAEHGEIIRRPDPADRRRVYVAISDDAFDAVARTLASSARDRASEPRVSSYPLRTPREAAQGERPVAP